MKRILLGLALISGLPAFSQQTIYSNTIDHNDVRAIVSNNGTFFKNNATQNAGYTVPKNSFRNAIYFMNMVMSGTDVNGQLKAALSDYESSDFQPGPIATDYADSSYTIRYGISLWSMSRQEIDEHIAQWNQQGYTPTANILQWPGNGNPAIGIAQQLAPYHDANGNGIYDPIQGDYPIIRGDYAIYTIVNDDKMHTTSGADRIGVEMHLMLYQYNDVNAAINSTTFIHARIINRGTQTLFNFKAGNFVDYDLGNYADDYLGCDPSRNLSYCYNGDMNDESNAGLPGYGEYPPAIGVRYLNENLNNHFVFSSLDPVNTVNPASAVHMENILNGFDPTGSPVTDPTGQITPFMFNDINANGWNELNPNPNPPGDRRAVISIEPRTFAPGDEFCVDLAVVFATNGDSTFAGGVTHLMAVSDDIQAFYDQQGYACIDTTLGISTQVVPLVKVYPNPATSVLYVEGTTGIPFRILSADGKTVTSGTGMETAIDIDSLKAGYYIFINEKGSTVPFVKQ